MGTFTRAAWIVAAALCVAAPSGALAQQEDAEGPSYTHDGAGVVIGLRGGVSLGQPFGEFETSPSFELELGWLLPPMDRALELFFAAGYAALPMSGTAPADMRLPPDGVTSYEITQEEVVLTLGILYRIAASDVFRPYVAAGGRVYLMNTVVNGSAGGEPFGQNEETSTSFGFVASVGGELYLGPGALLLQVGVGWAAIDNYVLRDTQTGALEVSLGYRLFL